MRGAVRHWTMGLCLAVLWSLGSSPAAAQTRPFGINEDLAWDQPALVDPIIDNMVQAGVQIVRMDFRWYMIEPSNNQWDFSTQDVIVNKLRARGIEVLGLLDHPPAWANGGHTGTYPPLNDVDWRDFVLHVADHFKGRVGQWEIWNEENLVVFFSPQPDAARYVRLLKNGFEAIKSVDAGARVVLGGLGGNGVYMGWEAPEERDFLQKIYDAGGKGYFDVVAAHPYLHPTAGLDSFRSYIQATQAVMAANGDGNRPLWLTEIGWSTSPNAFFQATINEQQAADWLQTIYEARASLGIERMFWYNFRDLDYDPNGYQFGLVHGDLSPRLTYTRFAAETHVPDRLNLSHDLVPLGLAAQNLTPNNSALDARPLFEAGLQYVQAHHIPLMTVDPGSYYFLTTVVGAPDRYMNLYNVSDLTLDFAGSMLYFKDPFKHNVNLTECQRVTVTNFKTDYINAPYTHATITGVNASARRVSYQTQPGWVDPVTFNTLTASFGPIELWAVFFRNGSIVPGTSRTPVTPAIAGNAIQFIQDNAPWDQAAALATLQPGDTIVLTARGGGSPVEIFHGDAIVISNATVFGSSNWAVVMDTVSNSLVDHVEVRPRANGGLVGSNADGIHFSTTRNNNHVRNSYVTRTIDDGIAIDALATGTVMSRTDARHLHVRRSGFARFLNGVLFNFVNVATTAEIDGGIVIAQNPADATFPSFDSEADLTFDRDLPALSPGDEIVFGSAEYRGAGSTIEDNVVEDLLFGRGIWVSGNDGVTVQRNRIGHTSNGGIVVAQDTKAYPGPPARNVVIHSNIVAGSLGPMASGTGTQIAVGAIMIESTNLTFGFGQLPVNANISIRSNFVADSGRAGIWVGELNGGAIQDNVIVRWNQHPELPTWGMCCADLAMVQTDFAQPLATHFSTGLIISNNTSQAASILTGPIDFDPPSATFSGSPGDKAVTVHASVPGFSWVAQSNVPWLTLVTTGGIGSGALQFRVSANHAGTSRQGMITIAGRTFAVSQGALRPTAGDLDGDGQSDLLLWRPSTGTFYGLTSGSSYNYAANLTKPWGANGDVPLRADLDGDGQAELIVWRPSTGTFHWLTSATGYTVSGSKPWGANGDVPLVADVDGDGKGDLIVWRPGTGTFYWTTAASGYTLNGSAQWGANGDVPLLGDVDGDGKSDLVIWRPSTGTFHWLTAASGYTASGAKPWGANGDVPLVGDVDGDGKSDLLIWRPSTGTFYWVTAASGYATAGSTPFGANGDAPLLLDVDGDGKADLVVWRPSNGTFYWVTAASSYTVGGAKPWGANGDVVLGAPGRQARNPSDQDGDGKTDLAIWRPSDGTFYWLTSTSSYNYGASQNKSWGGVGDVPLRGDLDGDGKADLVVWRPSTGTFYWLTSASGYNYGAQQSKQWGGTGDVPLLADLDGDGKAELIVWRESDGTFYWLPSASDYNYGALQSKQWGGGGDKPLIGDLDGDGKGELIVWRQSDGTFYWLTSASSYNYGALQSKQWGGGGDKPLIGDLDGDGKGELVVWRGSTGTFYWLTSASSYNYGAAQNKQWGGTGDLPQLPDIDGDGKADLAVWRNSDGTFYWLTSSSGYNYGALGSKQWGGGGDVPLP